MESRIAVLGIIVDEPEMSSSVNAILHEYGNIIIGRMGIPYREKKVAVISGRRRRRYRRNKCDNRQAWKA